MFLIKIGERGFKHGDSAGSGISELFVFSLMNDDALLILLGAFGSRLLSFLQQKLVVW
jgi:hypothetical protein